MTEKAQILFEDAEKYAISFNEIYMDMDCHTEVHVLSKEKNIIEFFKKSEELKIHYMFPNVPDKVRDLFFKLAWRRAGLSLGKNSGNNEAAKTQMEIDFVELSSAARDLLDDLLPLQVEILNEKYLSNPFS